MSLPDLLTAEEVAHELGYADRTAVYRRIYRGDKRLAACRIACTARRSWSRARLVEGGYLRAQPVSAPAGVAASTPTPAPARVVAVWRIA